MMAGFGSSAEESTCAGIGRRIVDISSTTVGLWVGALLRGLFCKHVQVWAGDPPATHSLQPPMKRKQLLFLESKQAIKINRQK